MQLKQMIHQSLLFALSLALMPSVFASNLLKDDSIYGYHQARKIKRDIPQKKKLSSSEQEALRLLCIIGLNSKGKDAWANKDVNAAIATISWGNNWPDDAMTTAYKTCNFPGYGGRPRYPDFLESIELTQLSVGQCLLANVAFVDARYGAIEGEFGSENAIINLTNNYSLYLFRNLKDKSGKWKIHERSNPISLLDAKRMFKINDPINLCLKFESKECHLKKNDTRGNIYSISNRRTKEKRYGHIGFESCSSN